MGKIRAVLQPLVILAYERLLPGSQLVNRFQDMGYRVCALTEVAQLAETARREMPLLAIVDMKFERQAPGPAIAALTGGPDTRHIPVIAIVPAGEPKLEEAAQAAGAKLVVNDNAVQIHLQQLLDQALQVE